MASSRKLPFYPFPSLHLCSIDPVVSSSYRIILLFLVFSLRANTAENWPRFRGPLGTGHHSGVALPTQWSAGNVLWRAELKGAGHSSPVIWGERVFLTAATDQGRARFVLALDARSGKLLWEKSIPCDAPGKSHNMNGFATPTCLTDGERVVAFFGKAGIHCVLDGETHLTDRRCRWLGH